jgi:AcrR family transcriptional regulator
VNDQILFMGYQNTPAMATPLGPMIVSINTLAGLKRMIKKTCKKYNSVILQLKYNTVIQNLILTAQEYPMTAGKEKRTTQNRKKILAAARTIILDQGIQALSVRSLAAKSELALKTIYNLYGNKENVIIAIFEQGTRDIDTATLSLQNDLKNGPWKTAYYQEWIDAVEPLFLNNQAVIKPSIIAGFSLGCPDSNQLAELHSKRIKKIQKALEIAAENNLIWRDLNLAVCAHLAYHSYFNVVLQWARGDLDDRGLVVYGRYALHTILHTLINDPVRRENTLTLLRNLKEIE